VTNTHYQRATDVMRYLEANPGPVTVWDVTKAGVSDTAARYILGALVATGWATGTYEPMRARYVYQRNREAA
jgi:hypothetical protein